MYGVETDVQSGPGNGSSSFFDAFRYATRQPKNGLVAGIALLWIGQCHSALE
jgi:hypothetical protein